jgi:putative ATP-dependent endonuclease of OLD family
MHIKSVAIKNFRNFSNLNIDFTKGFQTIIGENNIGKSNFFWALRIVLDKNLSYNHRILDEKDFYGFCDLKSSSYIMISVEFYGEKLSCFPNFHALKTSDHTVRITYLYAHKSKLIATDESFENIDIKDFHWRLFGGGRSLKPKDVLNLQTVNFRDLDGVNLFFITGFRNINSELFGTSKSLLSQYCNSRKDSEKEKDQVKSILKDSSGKLNKLDFIPKMAETVKDKNSEIAGSHFSFPVSLGFITDNDSDVWSQLKLFFSPKKKKTVPLQILGLGQKNLLYLTLFLSKLINEQNEFEINILLIEEPEAHLHPQLQKILFSNLSGLENTQVFMSSHSTHIASDCDYKNLNILYNSSENVVKSFSPFNCEIVTPREELLLKRYLDATRSELFFASSVIFVEGVAEQFLIPAIAKMVYGINLTEYNISVIPIYSRYFDPYLKLFQEDNLEIPVCAIIDGDSKECKGDEETTAIENAKKLTVKGRVQVFAGTETLEIDLFTDSETNAKYLRTCFKNLGHKQSHSNLMKSSNDWSEELIKRIDNTAKKGGFEIPDYISDALEFIFDINEIEY